MIKHVLVYQLKWKDAFRRWSLGEPVPTKQDSFVVAEEQSDLVTSGMTSGINPILMFLPAMSLKQIFVEFASWSKFQG